MKRLILTVSLALALTMMASANGNEVSRAKTLVAYFSGQTHFKDLKNVYYLRNSNNIIILSGGRK